MRAAAELRKQIESALAERIPAALSVRARVAPELLSCGLPEVDAVLDGGLPIGAISELTGVHSSGRTTLALGTLAQATRQGESCAYVDVSDALDPLSASAFGVELRHLLWIRTGQAGEANVAGVPSPFSPATATSSERPARGSGWGHPRHETIGLHHAIGELFNSAPGHTSQITTVLDPDFTPRCSESIRRPRVQPVMFTPHASVLPARSSARISDNASQLRRHTPWTQLDRALRATDLLLSTGGFRVLVLDLADISPEQARRVPLATWYRFRLQAEKSRTLFLLMTRVPCANSCAVISLRFSPGRTRWTRASAHSPTLLTGLHYGITVERSRQGDPFRKKPAASVAAWSSATTWLG
jgi:recombination protein RecA